MAKAIMHRQYCKKLIDYYKMEEKNQTKEKNSVSIDKLTVFKITLYVLGTISIIIAWKWYNYDLDIQSIGDPYMFHEKRYVGGDAYNYIISAARSTAIMTKSLIWMIFGCTSLILGKLLSIKSNICK